MYQRDGGGRDSYIFDTNGGFSNVTFNNKTFWKTFRDGKSLNPGSSRGTKTRSSTREKHLL